MIHTLTMSKSLLNGSRDDKITALVDLTKAMSLDDVTIETMHKAHKAESIREPHLNPVIWKLEKEFYGLWEPKSIVSEILTGIGISQSVFTMKKGKSDVLYNPDGNPLASEDILRLEKIIAKALNVSLSKVREILTKSASAAKLASAEVMGKPLPINISKLPKTLRDAIKELALTQLEVRAIEFAYQYAAINIVGIQELAKKQIQNMVVESIQNKVGPRALANKMFNELALNDSSVLNRDWERIAITETNRVASDAYLSSRPEGSYVIGHSHPDACPHCMKYIDMQIYKVTHAPPPAYGDLKPSSKAYKKITEVWETEVWPGKTNVGRSFSPNKRVNGKLVKRRPDEMGMPTITLHPNCRCRYTQWIPDLYYIKAGRVEFAVDEDSIAEQKEWLKANPHIKIGK